MSEPQEPAYLAALDWLFSRTRAGAERTPRRAAALLQPLGLAAPPVAVSVVGTNGKGSVSTMTAAGLSAAGHRTGLFISPHVESFLERISVDGVQLNQARVTEFVATARELSEAPTAVSAPPPAFFEWTLALALHEFARQGAQAAVLEAGVGGASDATRAVEGVSLVVLTNVDLDHVDTLGPTLEAIAIDKVGAMRPGMPFVSGVVQPRLRALVAREAERLSVPLHQLDPAADDPLFSLPGELERAFGAGTTRSTNARLSAAALRLLGVGESAVASGLRAAPLPARGERFVLPGEPPVEVLLDGAHDPAAAQRLVQEVGGRAHVLLFGALGRKQGAAVLAELAPGASHVIVTEAQVGDGPVGGAPAGAQFLADPVSALDAALALAQQAHAQDPLLVVAGSLYLAGRVRPLLRQRGTRQPAPWEPAHRVAPTGDPG